MFTTLRTLPLVSAGLVAAALTAGCSNGLQTTSAGADPSLASPTAAAATSGSASPSTETTPSASASTSASATANRAPTTTSTTPVASSTSARSGAGHRCTVSHLAVGVREADGGGAAGSRYVLLTFRNTGSNRCTLYGFPGVSFVGHGNGTQLGVPAVRDGSAAKTVKLSSGSSTTALLRIVNAGVYDASSCAPTTADGFRIYPPGSTTSAYVRFAAQACQKDPGSSKQLTVSPVGTSG